MDWRGEMGMGETAGDEAFEFGEVSKGHYGMVVNIICRYVCVVRRIIII